MVRTHVGEPTDSFCWRSHVSCPDGRLAKVMTGWNLEVTGEVRPLYANETNLYVHHHRRLFSVLR